MAATGIIKPTALRWPAAGTRAPLPQHCTMPPRKRKTRDEGGDDSPAAVKAKLRAQLDQRVDERIERNAVAEKRR